jgi:hypothetical protein
MYAQLKSLSTASSMTVQVVFLSAAMQYGRAESVPISTCTSSVDVKDVFQSSACMLYESLFTSGKCFFKFRNSRLSGILSVLYRNEQKCQCKNQSGTRIRGPTVVWYRNVLVLTEKPDAGLPMPSYVNYIACN